MATFSRYGRRAFPWHATEEEDSAASLISGVRESGTVGWALFPVSERDAIFVARHWDRLSSVLRLTLPPFDAAPWAYDKHMTYQRAAGKGIVTPVTLAPKSREEVEAITGPFPLVVKPAMKEVGSWMTNQKGIPVRDQAELLAAFDSVHRSGETAPLLFQEIVPGDGRCQFSYAALCRDGVPIASLIARRLRQFPIDFGRFSTLVETVDNREVREASEHFLEGSGYTGLVEIEYKQDQRTGQMKLLDVNPRAWGWHSLAPVAGVDFVYLFWRMLQGECVEPTRARTGVRWVWFSGDAAVSFRLMRDGRLSIKDYLHSLQGVRAEAAFAWNDPLPFFTEVPLRFYRRHQGKRAPGQARLTATSPKDTQADQRQRDG